MFGTRPKRITKLEVFSAVIFVIIMFVMGYVSIMTTTHSEKPGWKTYRYGEPEPNGDMQKDTEIAISQLVPQTNITQYRILFDEAHNPSIRIEAPAYDPLAYTRHYRLYLELLGLGHDVEVLQTGTITSSLLSNFDLLVIPGSDSSYLGYESDAIDAWVKSGGNILILVKSTFSNYYLEARGAIEIAQQFGFNFNYHNILDGDDDPADGVIEFNGANILPHPITKNIQNLIIGGIHGITQMPSGTWKILKTDDDDSTYFNEYEDMPDARNIPIMCALQNISGFGGRLVVLPVNDIWSTYRNHDLSMPYIYLEDNIQLAINTFNWLVDKDYNMKIDNDNDTLSDYIELYALNSNPYSNDTDQDNLLDIFEYENGMSLISNDTDTDGIFDFDEFYNYPTDPTEWDTDEDQLGDGDEYFVYFTNATLRDTDTDGIPDGFEVFNLMDPLDEADAELDYDNDQLTNLQEYKFGGNVYSNDTDSDRLSDSDELYIYFTKIYRNDTDFDGLMDWDELFIYLTDPRSRDTDGDEYPDRLEILEGWDPLDPNDPVPRPNYNEPRPTVQISASIFSILAFSPVILFVTFIKRKKMIRN